MKKQSPQTATARPRLDTEAMAQGLNFSEILELVQQIQAKHQRRPDTGKIRPCPWPDIEAKYERLIALGLDFGEMLELVRHIQATGLSERLFAFTSMHKLVVGIYDPMESDREALHIEIDIERQEWYFLYRPRPGFDHEHFRKCGAGQGIEKFEGYVRKLKW